MNRQGKLARLASIVGALRTDAGGAVLLVVATIAALVWANLPLAFGYSDEYGNRVGGPDFVMQGNDMLGTYPLIDPNDDLLRFGFGWFDPTHNEMLRKIGSIQGDEVQRTPRPADIPDEIYEAMIRKASRWDEPWWSGVIEAFRARDLIAAPISEYVPHQWSTVVSRCLETPPTHRHR